MQLTALLRPLAASAAAAPQQSATLIARVLATPAATPAHALPWWPSQLAAMLAPGGACVRGQQQQQQWRHKHTVKMVLMQDHPRLGAAGSLVEVPAGRARHELFPSGAADYATPGVLRQLRARGFLRDAGSPLAPSPTGGPGASAPQLEGNGGGGGGATAAARVRGAPAGAEVAEALRLLSSRTLVVRRRYRWRTEAHGMVGCVNARDISGLAARQLRVGLPPRLVLLGAPITEFGEFKVPLNVAGTQGTQVELRVEVLKTRHM